LFASGPSPKNGGGDVDIEGCAPIAATGYATEGGKGGETPAPVN
jgi:hypothetical protein